MSSIYITKMGMQQEKVVLVFYKIFVNVKYSYYICT